MASSTAPPPMFAGSSDNPACQTWHVSRGIALKPANQQVVYPLLPSASPRHLHTRAARQDATSITAAASKPIASIGHRAMPAAAKPATLSLTARAHTDANATLDRHHDPPFTPLKFKIPEEVYVAARQAPPDHPASFLFYTLYRGPGEAGPTSEKVKLHYCLNRVTAERVCQEFFSREKVVAFDLEWDIQARRNDGPRKHISLVQLASESHIALFHLANFPRTRLEVENPYDVDLQREALIPPTLQAIMESPDITKVGVCIKSDVARLSKHFGINSRGIFELSHLYNLVKISENLEKDPASYKDKKEKVVRRSAVSLASQALDCIGLPMYKGNDIRLSSWHRSLNRDQIIYAASDPYAIVQLYAMLNHRRSHLKHVPPLPPHAELNQPIPLADGLFLDEEPNSSDAAIDAANARAAAASDTHVVDNQVDIEILGRSSRLSANTKVPEPPSSDPRVIAAHQWALNYRENPPRPGWSVRVTLAPLRAYRLWHEHDDLRPEALAQLLRDPPLLPRTVANYVMETIHHEQLPFDPTRLTTEIFTLVPGVDVSRMRVSAYRRRPPVSSGSPAPESSGSDTTQ